MIRTIRLLPALACAALLTACAGQNAANAIGKANLVPSVDDAASRQTFHFTDRRQSFQVPGGVAHVTITAKGAGTPSARGGLVKAKISVHPGDVLTIFVGGMPHDEFGGYNGGGDGGPCSYGNGCPINGKGGAGASDVRLGGDGLRDRVVVAGGAGGRGGAGQYHGGPGGDGGGVSGGRGTDGIGLGYGSGFVGGGGGGGGGTQHHGGRRGAAGETGNSFTSPGNPGRAGKLGFGGTGADNYCDICSISYGLLAGGSGGGGGGGYYGGGGGGSGANGDYYSSGREGLGSGGGGGGGSSFAEAGAQNVIIESGKGNTGDGLVVISW